MKTKRVAFLPQAMAGTTGYAIGIIITLLFLVRPALAQQPANTPRPVTLYYNRSMELTTKDKMEYRREAMMDFENITFAGICKDYYANGKLASDAYFENDVVKGLNTEYDEEGKLRSTIEYGKDGFVIWDLITETGTVQISHGTGKFNLSCYSIEPQAGGGANLYQTSVKGEFLLGKRAGIWVYTDKNAEKTDEEVYERGQFVERRTFTPTSLRNNTSATIERTAKNVIISLEDILAETFQFEAGTFASLNECFERSEIKYSPDLTRAITFPGGMKKILLMIALGLTTEVDENQIVKLSVDEKGKFEKIKANFLLGSGFSEELSRLVKPHASKFLPAVVDGTPVSMTMKIPVANSPEWIHYLQTATNDDVNAYLDELNRQP